MSGSWQTGNPFLASLVLSVDCAACGVYGTRDGQTHLMEGQIHKQETQEKEDLDWVREIRAPSKPIVTNKPRPDNSRTRKSYTIGLYASIFPNAQLRDAIENYVVQANPSRTQFAQRHPRPDELRRSNLRETVKRAEQYMAAFQKQHPHIDLKHYLG